jgi:hypothetical protein
MKKIEAIIKPFKLDEVKDAQLIALLFQQMTRIAQDLALWIEHDERRVTLHDIGFGVEARLTAAAAAHHHDVEIAPVLAPIQPNADILREKDVIELILVRIFTAKLLRITPFGAAVLLTLTVIAFHGVIDADAQTVD